MGLPGFAGFVRDEYGRALVAADRHRDGAQTTGADSDTLLYRLGRGLVPDEELVVAGRNALIVNAPAPSAWA